MALRRSAIPMSFCVALAGASLVGAAIAQQPAAPPVQTWAEQQREQAWATEELAKSPLRSEWMSLPMGARTLRAFVTYPAKRRKAPVVLVIHEVFGLTDSTRNTARRIAEMGYVTIAPDMVSGLAPNGGGVSDFPNVRMTSDVMTTLPDDHAVAQFNAWADYAARLPQSDGRFAIVGLSWGGGSAFRYAGNPAHDRGLQAVCIFYDVGPPAINQGPNKLLPNRPPASVDRIDVPIYGFYGSTDMRVMKSLQATTEAMQAAGKHYEPVVYDGADHAYLRLGGNPADGNPANDRATADSYARLEQILADLDARP